LFFLRLEVIVSDPDSLTPGPGFLLNLDPGSDNGFYAKKIFLKMPYFSLKKTLKRTFRLQEEKLSGSALQRALLNMKFLQFFLFWIPFFLACKETDPLNQLNLKFC
jgi:hypothetical protein